MTPRLSWVPVVLLVLATPVLTFPAVLDPAQGSAAAAVGILTLVYTVWLLRDHHYLPWFVGLLAMTSVTGWVMASDQPAALNHFCGLALGLFTMGTMASWCRTRERFTLATAAFLLCGAAALGIGNRSTPPVHTSKALFKETTAAVAPVSPLPLRELHQRTSVNRNALAAAAMMVLPVAAAVALTPVRARGIQTAIRLGGLVTALWAAVIVVIMQSRSAWMSALIVLWVSARGAMRPKHWWTVTATGAFLLIALVVLVWRDHPRTVELVSVLSARVGIWEQGLQALQPSPWFGIGLDYFRHSGYSPIIVWPDQIGGRPHAHNFFLQTALDVGVIGLAGYLLTVAYMFWRAVQTFKSRTGDPFVRYVAAGAALSLVSVHVYGIFDAVALGTKVGIFQWVVCGLVLAAWRIHANTGPDQAAS